MIKYNSQKQITIFDFHTEFHSKLDPENHWVKMANTHQNWVASIEFVMNILRAMKDFFWLLLKQSYIMAISKEKSSIHLPLAYSRSVYYINMANFIVKA